MKVRINGPIISDGEKWIYNYFGVPSVSPKDVTDKLDRAERQGNVDVKVIINSGGGSFFAASEIYTALKSYQGNVDVDIAGLAASSASLIAMAGRQIGASPTGQVMVHNASMQNEGDYRDMDNASELLQGINKSIMNAYIIKTKKSEAELKAMLDKTTWMTAQQAKENGFVDKILFDDYNDLDFVASADSNGSLPRSVIEKLKNELATGKLDLSNRENPIVKSSFEEGSENIAAASIAAGSDFEDLAERARKLVVENDLSVTEAFGVINQAAPLNKEEGEKKMDLETLKNEHLALYEQIKSEGYKDGVDAENERIKSIEDLAMPGNEDLVNGAKYEERITGEQLAVKIIMADKKKGINYLNNRNDDAAGAGAVNGSPGTDPVEPKNNAAALAAAMGGGL